MGDDRIVYSVQVTGTEPTRIWPRWKMREWIIQHEYRLDGIGEYLIKSTNEISME